MRKHNIGQFVTFKCKDTTKKCGGIIESIDSGSNEATILLTFKRCKAVSHEAKRCAFFPNLDNELEPTEEEKLKAIKVLIVGGGNEEVDKV